MPVLVALVPPQILKPAPELVRLLDPPDLLAPRKLRLRRKLQNQPPQRFLHPLRQLLVIRPVQIRVRRRRALSAGCRSVSVVILQPTPLIFVG